MHPPPQSPSPGRAASPSTSAPFFPPPVRITRPSPPLKRRRTRSKPPTVDQDAEIAKAREASALRLLDVWSSLANKYARGLDEDDVIDVMTGKLVEDRGVLATTKKAYRVGCFQQDEGEETEVEDEEPDIDDSEGVSGEIDADEDEDELDTLSKIASKQKVDSITLKERAVPPVQVDQEVDAEVLREFLEEEQKRKVRYGEEESSSGESDVQDEDTILRAQTEYVDHDDEEEEEENAALSASSDWDFPPPSSATDALDSDEDELASNWQIDEASIVIPVSDAPTTRTSQPLLSDTDSDSEIEIIGPPRPVDRQTFSRGSQAPRASMSFYRYQRQLDTPPLTHSSSSVPSSTPFDEREQHFTSSLSISTLPPSSPPPSSPRTSPMPSSSPRRSLLATSPIISATPKSSSKFKPHSSPPPPITRLDLSKANHPFRFRTPSKRTGPAQIPIRSLPPSRSGATIHDAFSDLRLPVATDESDVDSIRKQRNRVEVLITRRTPVPTEQNRSLSTKESSPVVPPASRKGKGKEKADITKRGPLSVDSQEEDTIPVASSPIKTPSMPKRRSHRRRSESQPPSTATSPVALLSKKPSTPPRGRASTSPELELPPPNWSRKRKRVVSAEQKGKHKAAPHSAPASEDDDEIFTKLPPITTSKARAQSRQRPDLDSAKQGLSQHPQTLTRPRDYLDDAQYSLAIPHSGHLPSAYTSFADPRLQFVMAQAVQHAMQQYDALVHSPHPHPHSRWTGSGHPPMISMPFHPPPPSTYYHHPSLPTSMTGPSISPARSSSSSSYSYGAPALRDHVAPRETPSSDNTDHLSSPGIPTLAAAYTTTAPTRRKSLVHRSQSRGRKVSFQESEEITLLGTSRETPDAIPIKVSKSVTSSTYQLAASTPVSSKGKGKVENTARRSSSSRFVGSLDDHESEDEPLRGRPMARAQTPGPSVAANARHDTKTGAKLKPVVSDTTDVKKRTRSRKG